MGSSQTRAQTRVPCIGRQILNHCATREAHPRFFMSSFVSFWNTKTNLLNLSDDTSCNFLLSSLSPNYHSLSSKISCPFAYVGLSYFFFLTFIIYFWLCWVFASVRGLSPAAASGGHSSSQCAGLSLSRPLLLRSTGSRRAGSVVVAHGPSRSAACGILPDQGSNPRPLH